MYNKRIEKKLEWLGALQERLPQKQTCECFQRECGLYDMKNKKENPYGWMTSSNVFLLFGNRRERIVDTKSRLYKS